MGETGHALVPGITHHNLLLILLQFAVLLVLARGLGHAATRVKMPSVLGELLAGVLLGPSILGQISPATFAWLFPPEALQRNLLDLVAFLGVTLLLILTGLEVDLPLIASRGTSAAKVSAGGIIVPFGLGVATAFYLVPPELLTDKPRLTFALFLGTALSISAIPVIAKVLIELKMIKRDIGQLTLAAGMIDDSVGWILLSVVAGLAQSGTVELAVVLRSLVSVVAFVGLTLTLGRRVFGVLLRWVDVRLPGEQPQLTLLIALALGMGALSHLLGIEAVLGVFLVGIVFGTLKRFDRRLIEVIETWCLAVFAPIFFARAGLSIDLSAFFNPSTLVTGMLILAVAIVGKFVGAYLGASWAGLGRYEALSLGAGMNARGALEIIVATIGFNLGILGVETFSIIVMVAIVTSLMAPPLLRWSMSRVPLSPAEQARLQREERRSKSFLGNVDRVLVPTRGGQHSQLAAQVVARMFRDEEVEVTILVLDPSASSDGDVANRRLEAAHAEAAARTEQHLASMSRVEVRRIVRAAADPARAAIEEAGKGYDLIVVGAAESGTRGLSEPALFSRFVDHLLRQAPCAVLVISQPLRDCTPGQVAPPAPLQRILLPTTGEQSDREGAEVAFALARQDGAVVDAVHFLITPQSISGQMRFRGEEDLWRVAEGVTAKEAELGRGLGVAVLPNVVPTERSIEDAIVSYASETQADLIVFRSDERSVTERAFFSHPLDHILSHSPCPVAIITNV